MKVKLDFDEMRLFKRLKNLVFIFSKFSDKVSNLRKKVLCSHGTCKYTYIQDKYFLNKIISTLNELPQNVRETWSGKGLKLG